MNLVYNSEHFSVVEYPSHGAFELIDKQGRTTAFFVGDTASKFRDSIQGVISANPSVESIDEFLDDYEPPNEHTLTFH